MKKLTALVAVCLCLGACQGPPVVPGTDTTEKALLSFSFAEPPAEGAIDEAAGCVTVEVPAAADLAGLVAVFEFTGESVTVNGVAQESGVTPNDFRSPVTYDVHAGDGTAQPYVVTVARAAPLCSEKAMTSFGLVAPAVVGEIDQAAGLIRLAVPHGTDISSLVACFVSTGARVTVDDTEQQSGVTINDFSDPLPYVVRAEDGTTTSYLVTVTVEPDTQKALSSFSILSPPGVGLIDADQRIIRVRLPPGTDLSALVAEFTATGPHVSVAGAPQASGVSVNDFRSPVEYVVSAEDGSSAAWDVRVVGTMDLVINELDIDQPGTDTAEFVELYTRTGVDLCGLALVLVNGGVLPGLEYSRVDLGTVGVLGPDSFLVVAGPGVIVTAPGQKLTPPSWALSNRIQNGPNDAVVLFDCLGHRIVDTVAYDGVLHRALLNGEPAEIDVTEGSTGAPADSGSTPGTAGRVPNGTDTGQNGVDFRFCPTPTPGATND